MSIQVGERPPPDAPIANYPLPDYEKELETAKDNACSVSINTEKIPPYLRDLKQPSFSTILPLTLQVK